MKEAMERFIQRVGSCRLDELKPDFSNLAAWLSS